MQKENNVYILGTIGNYGTKILIVNEKEKLLTRFSSYYLDKVLQDLEDGLNARLDFCDNNYNKKNNILDVEEIGKGGFLASLWKICDRNKFGLRYSLKTVPILQGIVEITNYFGINPYRLYTKNAKIFLTSEELNIDGIPFIAKIGETNGEKKRVRVDGEVEAFLTKDYKDELYKVVKETNKV